MLCDNLILRHNIYAKGHTAVSVDYRDTAKRNCLRNNVLFTI